MQKKTKALKAQSAPISFIHNTPEGQIHLWVSEAKDGGWNARLWGGQVVGARHFPTVEDANSYLTQSFGEMFREHRCNAGCGMSDEVSIRRSAEIENVWFHGKE